MIFYAKIFDVIDTKLQNWGKFDTEKSDMIESFIIDFIQIPAQQEKEHHSNHYLLLYHTFLWYLQSHLNRHQYL
jgi:hypothetical protein